MMQALGQYYHFKIFSKNEVEDVFFDDVDMVAFPGGIGDSDSWHQILKPNKTKVLDFVARGGRYLGICMGAYWAGSHYFDILKDVDAVQYITQPNTDTRRPHAKDIKVNWNGQDTTMFFYDGCALEGDRTKFETYATYANGDPMAIFQGRIGIMGCHPEAEENWYTMYSWLRNKWHGGQQDLLLEFVNLLMTK
jgi:hypothetical protein